jgi:NADH dehydrogenase/NADH:ubiquinone oxidoreductase subunit G
MKVRTHSTQLQKIRKTLIELLLARSPNALVVQKMARDLGVKSTPHPKQDELCILCGQCVRTCREIVGAEALSFVHKGSKRMVGVPFYRDSRECIGCGSCVFVCPTGVVKMHDVISDEQGKSERIMDKWETRLPLQECGSDGNTFATKRMLERFAQQYEVSEGFLEICSHCRHK